MLNLFARLNEKASNVGYNHPAYSFCQLCDQRSITQYYCYSQETNWFILSQVNMRDFMNVLLRFNNLPPFDEVKSSKSYIGHSSSRFNSCLAGVLLYSWRSNMYFVRAWYSYVFLMIIFPMVQSHSSNHSARPLSLKLHPFRGIQTFPRIDQNTSISRITLKFQAQIIMLAKTVI